MWKSVEMISLVGKHASNEELVINFIHSLINMLCWKNDETDRCHQKMILVIYFVCADENASTESKIEAKSGNNYVQGRSSVWVVWAEKFYGVVLRIRNWFVALFEVEKPTFSILHRFFKIQIWKSIFRKVEKHIFFFSNFLREKKW